MWKQLRQAMRGAQAEVEPTRSDAAPSRLGTTDAGEHHGPARIAPPHLDSAALQAGLERASLAAPALASSLRRLDPWQLAAVLDTSPSCLVRAQVGSGKTAVLSHKLLYLHLVDGVPLERLLAVTFTNKAAAELRNRILALAPETPLAALQQVGTFHGVARYWLEHRLPLQEIGLRRGFAIVDEPAEAIWVGQLIRDHGLHIQYPARVLQRLSRFRRTGQIRSGAMQRDDDLALLDQLAAAARKSRNVVNFDDLLALTTTLLAHQPLQPALDWLLLDEAQDCEPRERVFLEVAGTEQTRRFAVGDPLQSIYAFRGSAATSLRELAAAWLAAEIVLPQNYRSTQPILDAARGVLGSQREGGPGALVAVRPGGGPIGLLRQHDAVAEAGLLAALLRDHVQHGGRLGDLAVLTRTRRLAEQLAEGLKAAGVAAQLGVRRDPGQEPAVRWVQAAMQLGAHEADPDALRALVCDADYGLLGKKLWPQAAWRRWLASPQAREQPVWQLAAGFVAQRKASGVEAPDAAFAADWLRRLGGLLDACPAEGQLVPWLWEQLALDQVLRPTSHRHEGQVAALRGWLQAFEAAVAAGGWPTDPAAWGERLRATLALATLGGLPALREQREPLDDAVAVLTLHASKGLEFPVVVISGCNEGVLPLRAVREASGEAAGEALAEERRLLYVGLTRARDGVLLTWHGQPGPGQAFAEPSSLLLGVPARLQHEPEQALVAGLAAVRTQRSTAASSASAPLPSAPAALAAAAATALPQVDCSASDLRSPAPARAPAPAFAPGAKVLHPRYGKGEVLAADSSEVLVRFGKLGEKSFSALLSPLRAADE